LRVDFRDECAGGGQPGSGKETPAIENFGHGPEL
jgi:hypothetical protein